MFFSVSSKLLLAGFCRNLPATRGNSAQIRPQASAKTYLQWVTNFQRFPSVFLYILYYLYSARFPRKKAAFNGPYRPYSHCTTAANSGHEFLEIRTVRTVRLSVHSFRGWLSWVSSRQIQARNSREEISTSCWFYFC